MSEYQRERKKRGLLEGNRRNLVSLYVGIVRYQSRLGR